MNLLSIKEAASILRVSTRTVRAFIDKGELTAINLGTGQCRRKFVIEEDEISAFINRRKHIPPSYSEYPLKSRRATVKNLNKPQEIYSFTKMIERMNAEKK